MAVKVRIPSPLLKLTNNQGEVSAEGNSVKEIFDDLEKNYPGIKERVYDEEGQLRRFINIYINEEDIRFVDGESSSVKNGDEISIIPAIAGGLF
ncbi:MAG: MoaD/ThiS family protein [Nitrospinota bacterium]|jgi:molybdopterin synthase sulfur carrier subunit|nr:MoaD/ThiS family protein [Nitrospinota bacterium]HJP19204.1 MoaD/ThiS family protein [Nitrospinota bacterium]|tara:strand:- start:281 stop:562 length:282 start_codon:yes stop_codon:yes gene_type:complete